MTKDHQAVGDALLNGNGLGVSRLGQMLILEVKQIRRVSIQKPKVAHQLRARK